MNTSGDTRHGSDEEVPKKSLGRKLLKLLLKFCVCLILFPAVFAGVGALIGLFTGSPLEAMMIGTLCGLAVGGMGFTIITKQAGSGGFPPGGPGGFGGGGMGGGDGGGAGP